MSIDSREYRELFLLEANEHLQSMNNELLAYEKDNARERIDSIFRSVHTLKGMAATMGYESIRVLCKSIENVLDGIRNNSIAFSRDVADTLFSCFDLLNRLVNDENLSVDVSSYVKRLEDLLNNSSNANASNNSNSSTSNANSNTSNISGNAASIDASSLQEERLPTTITVKLEDLDRLVDLVGELIIAKIRLESSFNSSDRIALTQFDRLISELQFNVMKLRLVPLSMIFNRLPRLVRDTASKLGKEVRLEVEGSEIEIDRSIMQAISDPLVHIIRNAIDHGIEMPEERLRNGKDRVGLVRVIASRMGERISISIEDDGKGIDVDALKAKAVEKGVISKEEADAMSYEDALKLLGTPGLSTAKQVTDVSGRGVGMDVVFKQVSRFGGYVSIKSNKGLGTSITLNIPLNVSIISALMVYVNEERYIIPSSNVVRTLKVNARDVMHVHGKRVIRVKDKDDVHEHIIPLYDMSYLLGINGRSNDNEYNIVIVDINGRNIGLVVDRFEYMKEVVVKRIVGADGGFTEATIPSDGVPVLIVDVTKLLMEPRAGFEPAT